MDSLPSAAGKTVGVLVIFDIDGNAEAAILEHNDERQISSRWSVIRCELKESDSKLSRLFLEGNQQDSSE